MENKTPVEANIGSVDVKVDPKKMDWIELSQYRTEQANKIAAKLKHIPVDHVVLPPQDELPYLSPL